MSPKNLIGYPFIELRSVDSTNNYAMAMVHAGMAQHGTVVFAHEQTKGKGQRHKQWIATKDENIILSVLVEPFELSAAQVFLLNMAVACGVHRFFCRHAGDATKIKWPNDLYWNDRKAGGILIENSIQGTKWKYAIIGMGINLNQTNFKNIPSKAVSLKQITGKAYDTVVMAKELLLDLNEAFTLLVHHPASIVADYHTRLYKLQEAVTLKRNNELFEAIIKGISEEGKLIVQHQTIESFSVGEVEWVME